MKDPLRILIIEEKETDILLIQQEINKNDIEAVYNVVTIRKEYVDALHRFNPDVILSDYSLTRFDGLKALEIRNELAPIVPFILITNSLNEEIAVQCMKEKANDYLLKENLKRIGHAIESALKGAQLRREKLKADEALKESEERFRTIFEESPIGIELYDSQGIQITANKASYEIFGIFDDSSAGFNLFDGTTLNEELKKRLKQGETVAYETSFDFNKVRDLNQYRTSRVDTAIMTYIITPLKCSKKRDIYGYLLQVQEVQQGSITSSSVHLNQLLERSQQLAHTGGWEWDIRKQELYWTRETYRIHDLDPDTEKRMGQELVEFSLSCYLPEYRHRIREAFTRCCEEGVSYDLEVELQTASGRHIWARTIGDPVVENGKIVRVAGNIMDITDAKQKELAVHYSEMKFRAIMEQAAEMLFLHDMQGNIIEVNRAACDQTGYTTDELLTMSVFDIDPDAETRLDRKNIWESLSQLQEKTFEVRHRRKDSSFYPAEVTAGKISFGNREYVLALVRNISARKQFEENLIESEQHAKALFTAIPDMIFQMDAHGVFLSYKAAREELYADPDYFIGRNVDSVLPSDVAELTKTKIRETIQTLDVQIYDYELAYPENEIRQYECRMVPYSPEEVIAIIRDITEKKYFLELLESQNKAIQENEERFRRIFEDSSVGIALVREDFRFMAVNEEFCRMIGRTEKEMKSLTFRELTHPEDLRNDVKNLRRLIKGEADVYTTEKRYLRSDGQTFWGKVKVSVIRNADGTFLSFLALIDDITERKEAETDLFLSQQRLQEMNATKDKFFSIIAHDLRNPFNSILGFSDILQERVQEQDYEEIEKYAGIIHRSTASVLNLLSNLLEWSRSNAGMMTFSPECLEIDGLIETITHLYSDLAMQKTITLHIDKQRKELVYGDKAMISIILQNLLSNAIKFTPSGGQIRISTERRENEIVLSVTNTGTSISPENLNKLFRMEESFSTVGTNNEKGTGLGLLLCREFAEKNGGTIWAESKPGEGNTFRVSIPNASIIV